MIVDITNKINDSKKNAAYADDVTAARKIIQLKNWWRTLCMLRYKFGYYPDASKSWLIVREKAKQGAFTVFKDTAIKITTKGQRHLGAVIGSSKYKREYVQNKFDELINQIKLLSMIAKTEPQAAYACFITAFKHKPSYIMRTIPDISNQLNQFDEAITSEFIPAITGGIHCSNIERKLLSLPSELGGLESQSLQKLQIKKSKAKNSKKHEAKLENIRSYLTKEQIRLNSLNHSQDFQHIVNAVKNSNSSMLCHTRKVASYHYDTTS